MKIDRYTVERMRPQTVQMLGIILLSLGLFVVSAGFFLLLLSRWMAPWIGSLGAFPFVVMAGGAALTALGAWLTWRNNSRAQ